jgi:hypothetical protein
MQNLKKIGIMDKKEILEKMQNILEDIDTMKAYAENEYLSEIFGDETVSTFYRAYHDLPDDLAEVMKSLKGDFGDMTMSDFCKME